MNKLNTYNVRWKTWSPENLIFKSNQLIKKVLPAEHILSWKSKSDRDRKMCERTGRKVTSTNFRGQPYSFYNAENYKGIMVQLVDIKSDFPSANIDFIDQTKRLDSVGNHKGSLDILVYLKSFHNTWTMVKCPKTNQYISQPNPNPAPIQEGYRMCYGGQGDANSMDFDEFHEMIQITEMIKDFLVDVIVPLKNGTHHQEDLLVA